jgi:Mu-like prophage I protein
MVNLKTVKGRELLKVGKWQVHKGGEFNVTPKLIQDAISAHEAGVLRKPTIRLGHGGGDDDERSTGDPAVGWVDNVRASEDGTTLYGDLIGVPQWLADNMPSAYPSLSIEGMYDYTAPDGTTHDFVLTGLALLGATMPGISSLKSVQDVEALYSGDIAAAIGEIGGTPVQLTAGIQIEAAEASPQKGNAVTAIPDYVAEALGIDASADEDTIKAKLAELKKPAPAPEPVEPKVEQVAAAASQLGLIMVDKDKYEAIEAAAAAGAQVLEQRLREADEGIVMAAVREGKIAPARRESWLAALKVDREGTSQVLASLAKGLIPLSEMGHGVGSEDVPQFDAEMQRVNDKVMARLGLAPRG